MLIYLAILAVTVTYFAICFVFSGFLVHSHRQPIVRTPEDYGMDYRDVEFKSADGLRLRGWIIPGKLKKTVIMTHPMSFNRHGFLAKNQGMLRLFRTDVDLLRTAKALNGSGYSVLMFDFRNHGESDPGITGVGMNEYKDVLGAVNYVKGHFRDHKIGFVSFCMGANSTIIAMSRGCEVMKGVKFMVAVQPVSAYVVFPTYMRKKFTPLSMILLPVVNALCKLRGGYSLNEISPIGFAGDVEVPTLYVQAESDPWTDLNDIKAIHGNTPGPKELWILKGKMERFDTYNYVGDHPKRMLEFVKKHFI